MTSASAARNATYSRNQRVMMSAGISISHKRTAASVALGVVLLALGAGTAAAQAVMPAPKFTAYDAAGNPCAGCLLYAYVAGTTTPQDTYTSNTLGTPNAHPVVLDSAGRATVFTDVTKSYKYTLKTAAGVDIWTVDNVSGPLSSVVTINAADTRGLRVTRTSADAGMSIASSGGSGKTYGIVSTSTGQLQIRDDADGTPSLAFIGNNITAGLSGTFEVSGGLLSVTGFGYHQFTASGAGPHTLAIRNTSAGTTNVTGVEIGNDTSAGMLKLQVFASNYTSLADVTRIDSASTGGLYLRSTASTGGLTFSTGLGGNDRAGVLANGRFWVGAGYASSGLSTPTGLEIGTQTSADRVQMIVGDGTGYNLSIGHNAAGTYTKNFSVDDRGYVQAARNPFFLAINSATDTGVLTGATVDVDSELSDIGANFSGDQFLAPVTGVYEFCAGVTYANNGGASLTVSINIAGALHHIGGSSATTAGTFSGCIMALMSAATGANLVVTTGAASVDISGGTSPRVTWFSGRLVQ